MPVLITVHSLSCNDGDVWLDKPCLELTRSRRWTPTPRRSTAVLYNMASQTLQREAGLQRHAIQVSTQLHLPFRMACSLIFRRVGGVYSEAVYFHSTRLSSTVWAHRLFSGARAPHELAQLDGRDATSVPLWLSIFPAHPPLAHLPFSGVKCARAE